MKSLAGFVGGAVLVALVLAFLVAGSTGATSDGLGACTVNADGSGSHLNIQAAVDTPSCDPINVGAAPLALAKV